MSLDWTREQPARWDSDKARIVAGAQPGVFDARFGKLKPGDLVPGEWWRVSEGGETVGYGWLDVVWGDAEILLAVAPEAQRKGAGAFILDHLEQEAGKMGLNVLYNLVRPTHPKRAEVTAFLEKRGFKPSEDGNLVRALKGR